jgi:hypothetical protein
MKFKNLIIILSLLLVVISCEENYNSSINKRRLTNNNWEVKTYVDYDQNNAIDIRSAQFSFFENGTITKIYDNQDTISSIWTMSHDGDYLTIGSNTFKITELTNRVMSLRYGDVEMFFVSL